MQTPRIFIDLKSPRPFIDIRNPRSYLGTPSPNSFIETHSDRSFIEPQSPRSFIETQTPSPRSFLDTRCPSPFVESPTPRPYIETPPPRSFIETQSPRTFFDAQSPRVVLERQPPKKDNIIIQEKLAKGKFPVYKAFCPAHNKVYALKAFPKNIFGSFQYQKEKLITKLNHPNVIKYIPIQCETSQFYALVTEYAPFGDFFEPTRRGLFDDEIVMRTYFRQLIEGLEYIHSQGVAHLDLKLENLMFGSDFSLKIIDFDQAQSLRDRSVSSGGSLCFRAPEIAKANCRDLAVADVYSAGVVLFAWKTREYPFLETDAQNKKEVFYHYTFVKNNDVFWMLKSEKTTFSQDFIRLLNGMLEPVPEKRFRLADVKRSKWYNGPVLSSMGLEVEMRCKWEPIMKKKLP